MVEREDSRSVNFWLQLWVYGISGSRALYLHCQCRKAFGASTEETIALDEERRLQDLRSERDFMQARPHDGFADAIRVTGLDSEIQALEDHIAREKQRSELGQE
jgi:hypothetical protein